MRIREANEIEYAYIFSVLQCNINVEEVIIHSVIEKNNDVKYAIEVRHEERVTLFTASKSNIDNKNLQRNYFSKEEVYCLIKKLTNDCKIIDKYRKNYTGFVIEIDDFAFIISPYAIHACLAKRGKDYAYYIGAKSFLAFNSMIDLQIDTGDNHGNIDRIYADGMRLSHDSTLYSHGTAQNLDLEYFKNPDYFALSTICDITKDSYEYLCKIYSELDTIKHLEYKIKTGENMGNDETSYYRRIIKKYMKFDLEEAILTEIEKKYADYIKVP